MSQQGYRQAAVRAVTGSAETYEGDWIRLFDLQAIPAGMFNERMLRWINFDLGTAYTNLPEAMQKFAESRGAYDFASLGTFELFPTSDITLDDGTLVTDLAGAQLVTG